MIPCQLDVYDFCCHLLVADLKQPRCRCLLAPWLFSRWHLAHLLLIKTAGTGAMIAVPGPGNGSHCAVGVGVTGTGAISQLADGISGAINVFSWMAGPEVVGMAAGAIRLVSRGRPDNGLAVAGMTAQAGDTGIMIARIRGRTVAETDGYPGTGVVTVIALECRGEMPGRFARCGGAVMTVGTGTGC